MNKKLEQQLSEKLTVKTSSAMDQRFFRKLEALTPPARARLSFFALFKLQTALAIASLAIVGGIFVTQYHSKKVLAAPDSELIQDLDLFLSLDQMEGITNDS